MKKYVLGAISGLVVLVGGVALQWPDGKLHLVACDVGQGDGMVIFRGFSQVVVDGGPNQKIIECISKYMPFWDRRIELVLVTNGDADHITGLIDVIKRYKVDQIVANNLVKDTERFKALREEVIKEGVKVYGPRQGEMIVINPSTRLARSGSPLRFEVLWPERRLGDVLIWSDKVDERVLGVNSYDKNEANEQSVVVKLEYGGFSALLTGDIGSKSEEVLIKSGLDLTSDVLKVGHHGSKYSSTEGFLRAVRPNLAIVSVGRNNYGHPAGEVLGRLKQAGAKVLRTDEEGNIEIVSDGQRVWVK